MNKCRATFILESRAVRLYSFFYGGSKLVLIFGQNIFTMSWIVSILLRIILILRILGLYFLSLNFLDIFETLHFLKCCPIFVISVLCLFTKCICTWNIVQIFFSIGEISDIFARTGVQIEQNERVITSYLRATFNHLVNQKIPNDIAWYKCLLIRFF